MDKENFVKTIIINQTKGSLSFVIDLQGQHRVSIPAGEERTINSLNCEPFAGFSKVEYLQNGEVKTTKRRNWKSDFKKDDFLILFKNNHPGILNYKIHTIYSGQIILPYGIDWFRKISPLEDLAKWKEVQILDDIVADKKTMQMGEYIPIIRARNIRGSLRNSEKLQDRLPNLKYIPRSKKDLERLEKVRAEIAKGIYMLDREQKKVELSYKN